MSASRAGRIEVSGHERTRRYAIGPSCAARPKSNAAIDVLTASKNGGYALIRTGDPIIMSMAMRFKLIINQSFIGALVAKLSPQSTTDSHKMPTATTSKRKCYSGNFPPGFLVSYWQLYIT